MSVIRREQLIEDEAFFWPRDYAKQLEALAKKSREIGGKGSPTQKAMSELEKVQKQISVATERSTDEYVQQKAALDRLRKSTRDQVRDINTGAGAYNKLSRRLDETRNAYKNLAAQNRGATREAKALRQEAQRLDAQLKKIDKTVGQNQRGVGSYAQAMKKVAMRFTAFLAIGAAVFRLLKSGITIVLDYSKANSTLSAVMGKTSKQTAELRKQQRELGKATAFSATQVAKAQTELARLGLTMDEILDLTPGILDAAVAFGVDMAQAAELVAGNLNAFSLEAREGARVSDVLVKSTQISAFNFERLSTSLAIVGPAAKAFGDDIETATAKLTAAVDANIDASTSATALRNIYITLADRGMTWDEAMSQIRNSTDSLTEANELFGKRGAVVAQVMANNTEKIRENTKALNEAQGAAREFAETQMDNLRGDITLLTSAWEGFILSIEEGNGLIARAIRWTVQALTNDLQMLTDTIEDSDKKFENWKKVTREAGHSSEFLAAQVEMLNKKLEFEEKMLRIGTNFYSKERRTAIEGYQKQLGFLQELLASTIEKEQKNTQTLKQNTGSVEDNEEALEKQAKERQKALKDWIKINDELDRTNAGLSAFGVLTKEQQLLLDFVEGVFGENEIDEDARNFVQKVGEAIKEVAGISQKAREKELEQIRLQEEAKKQIREQGVQGARQVAQTLLDITVSRIQQEVTALEFQRQNELARVEDNELAREQINRQFDAKRAQLQKKEANANKLNALFNIALNTAQGITKALATLGPLAGPAVAIIAGIGAVQSAAVLATPIPEFAEGTEDSPDDYIAGEKGRELRIDKKGKISLVDKKTRFKGKQYEHSTIIPNKETDSILGDLSDVVGDNILQSKQGVMHLLNNDFEIKKKENADLKYVLKQNNKELIRTIKNKKETSIYVNGGKSSVMEKSGNTYVNRIDYYYKR